MQLCFLSLLLFASNLVFANNNQEEWSDDWDDEWSESQSPWQYSGFYELAYGQRLQEDSAFNTTTTLNELRAHLELEYKTQELAFNFKVDSWYDDVLSREEFDVRELSFNFTPFSNTDIRIGRQISTWGTGDLLFLNDLFPKDWQSFFSGRDTNYLKAPSDSIRISSFFETVNLDLVWTPEFQPDRFINGQRFSLFSPFFGELIGGEELIQARSPSKSLGNGELSVRLYKTVKATEYAIYAYRGFDKQPIGSTHQYQPTFHRRNVFGASIRGNFASGLYNLEVSFNDSMEDEAGDNPLVSNSQWRFLIGFERELASKLTWSSQYYLERTSDYKVLLNSSLNPQFEPEKTRQVLTQRFSYQTLQDKLTWGLFVYYSPTDEDIYLRPQLKYRQNDQWSYHLGANVFGGEKAHTFFGQFEDSSNAYIRIRYNF